MKQVTIQDSYGNTIFAGTRSELAGGIFGSLALFFLIVYSLIRTNKLRIKNAKAAAIKKEEKNWTMPWSI